MHTYRSGAMQSLADQLKRSPVRLRLRQLRGIEFVLSVLEPRKKYPVDFVTHALTNYRAARNGEHADAPLLGAEAIREDLVALAEELSAAAAICAASWPEPLTGVAELAERFHVSSKTIFRWHRRGLIGWRVLGADGRMRLAFPERCVRRFVADNASLVERGASFSQLTDTERDAIVARAFELAQGGEPTINSVAKVIAGESGRAIETIRLILKGYDEAHPRDGIFNRSRLQVAADDHRLAIWEAYVDGASVRALAGRFGLPVQRIYAAVTEMRARALKADPIDFIDCDAFAEAGAEESILAAPELATIGTDGAAPRRVPPSLPPYLRELFRTPLLTREQEVAIFRQMNYLRYLAEQRRAALDPETATARELDEIERLVDEANEIKNRIVQANLRLVVSIAKRHASPTNDLFEIISDGNISLMRAVDRFDFNRGFKFSTYASWAIIKNFARSVPEERVRRDRYQTGRDEMLEVFAGQAAEEQEFDERLAARQTIERMLDTLDPREREILRQRYGLDSYGDGHTLEQIGQRYGVSKERIRQLESRAIQRLRREFADQAVALLG